MKTFFLIFALFLASVLRAGEVVRIACVDCYSSASLYPSLAKQIAPDTEIEWVLVQTHPYSESQAAYLGQFPQSSIRLQYDPNQLNWLDRVETDFRRLGVSRLLEGMDEGSYQGSAIASRMGFNHNSVEMRAARKRKDLQMVIAGEYGIPTEPFLSVDQALRWANSFAHEQIVVKFNDGVSGVGMDFFSKSDPELKLKLQRKLDGPKIGPFGREDSFIVQPRIEGRKFFINTYTYEGKTVVTGLSEYNMLDWNGTTLYFLDPYLDHSSRESRLLEPIARTISERMEVRYGPSHIEFILDSLTGKVFLLENNVRIAGAGVPALENAVYGMGQMELHLLSVLDPTRLREAMATYPRKMQTGGLIAVIPASYDGKLSSRGVEIIESLGSYFKIGPQYALLPGTNVKETRDQNTAAALIHLTGSRAQIQMDVQRIIQMVRNSDLVTPPPTESLCIKKLAALSVKLDRTAASVNWLALPQ